jgi:flagellar biosynthetic protein FliO
MELTEQIAMVLVVFALLGGMLWFLKKRGLASLPLTRRRGAANRRMEVLERVPLTPQHAIHLVRVSGKVVLIGTAPSSCTMLDATLSEPFPASLPQNVLGAGQ